jgi:hypothetical protein
MPEVAAEFGAIYNDWDDARLLALFAPEARVSATGFRRRFDWIRDKLGECGAPAFMWSHGRRTARFSYPCERGALEASFTLDAAGKVKTLLSGAAGVETPPDLLAAAETVLASLPWKPGTERPFVNNLYRYDATKLGSCTMLRPWVVAQYGGLFHVRCEKGDAAILRLALHKNGTIAEARLIPSNDNYNGPPVEAPPLPPAEQDLTTRARSPTADEQDPQALSSSPLD